jgi:hypothetical protein
MSPPFFSTWRAVLLALFLATALLMPVLLYAVGLPPRIEVYRGISHLAGPFDALRHQVFEDKSELDMLIFGNSLVRVGFEQSWVRQELSRALGRPANVLLSGLTWQGHDMQYFVLRDLLEHRKVRMLVISMPARTHTQNMPHVQIFRLLRYGDFPGALDGLPLRYRISLYADCVLGAPRQALNLLRGNLVYPNPDRPDDPHWRDIGYMDSPFVPLPPDHPDLQADSMIYSAATRNEFQFGGPPLNPYQLHFARKIVELAAAHGTRIVIVHVPMASEKGETTVWERADWPELFRQNVAIVGVPPAALFAGITDQQFYYFYADEHLNRNGQQRFTRTITPALVKLYQDAFARN